MTGVVFNFLAAVSSAIFTRIGSRVRGWSFERKELSRKLENLIDMNAYLGPSVFEAGKNRTNVCSSIRKLGHF